MNVSYLVEQCYNLLPIEIKAEPWKVTDHGRKILQSENELNAYIAAYGEMHIVKCRAALQNFPFKELDMFSFEIFDWGCGQGLATLTLLEMLHDRRMLSQLEKIVLIEPSSYALERAKKWVYQYIGSRVKVIAINKSIPQSDNEELNDVFCDSIISINLFSNILDIHSINLSWLANKVANLAAYNYVICIGPRFIQNTNTRLLDFCGYFNPQTYFSCIDKYPYEYTSRTHHAYGCQTRCFLHKRSSIINQDYQERADKTPLLDPYDLSDLKIDNPIIYFYNNLRNECDKSFDIFLKPYINCDMVDVIAMSKSNGIVLVNVCTDLSEIENAYNRIKTIKENLFNIHLKTLKIDSITYTSVYNCVKTALYFPNNTQEEVEDAIRKLNEAKNNECKEKNKGQWTTNKDFFAYDYWFTNEMSFKDIFGRIRSSGFKYDYYEELISIISSPWHTYKEGDTNIKLEKSQESFVTSSNKRLRVTGVAGSGKTQVVAYRAVAEHLKTGDKVLILTFNITLIQYIRMRINQVPADFSPSMFEITNYHQFFKSKANQYTSSDITIPDFDNPNFFDRYRKSIDKYQTIIIDEVQDFKTSWLQSIVNNFLTENGSISVFGDGQQNIYEREMEAETKMPSLQGCGKFPGGRWPSLKERISMRILNSKIASLSSKFALKFISPDSIPLQTQIEQEFQFEKYYVSYLNLASNTTAAHLASYISGILEDYQLNPKDVVVLGQTIYLLRDIEVQYRSATGQKTMINFETSEQYKKIINNSNQQYISKDLKEVRRAAKTHFTTDVDCIKFSTIHSFKGWESNTVILLLQQVMKSDEHYEKENIPALINTALTRARCNLFIINLDNLTYHEFFRLNADKIELKNETNE